MTGTDYNRKFGNVVIPGPFVEGYTFDDLESETNYKFNCYLTAGLETYFSVVLCGTTIDVDRKNKIIKEVN